MATAERPAGLLTASRAGRAPAGRQLIAVASGKGGVGKSTVAVNLAVALAREGARCGLLDADLYGPSVPVMLGQRAGRLRAAGDGRIRPLEAHGLKTVSVGFMVPEGDALIWRGAALHKLIHDFIHGVDWGELDFLVVDLPPGTGDVPLSLHQTTALHGALLVTTPQAVAQADAARAATMLRELGIPVLGLIENMSAPACPHCGGAVPLYPDPPAGASGQLGLPLRGRIPFDPRIARSGDDGVPFVIAHGDSPVAAAFRDIARGLIRDSAGGHAYTQNTKQEGL
jgi:ATP-binding protein involved in chromosome partitioning